MKLCPSRSTMDTFFAVGNWVRLACSRSGVNPAANGDLDMVIEPDPAPFPVGVGIGLVTMPSTVTRMWPVASRVRKAGSKLGPSGRRPSLQARARG